MDARAARDDAKGSLPTESDGLLINPSQNPKPAQKPDKEMPSKDNASKVVVHLLPARI